MNSMKKILAATVLAGILSANGVPASQAGEASSVRTMKPLQGVSFDIGTKHGVGYFLGESGQCKLTLVVADKMKGDELPSDTPVRFDAAIDAGTEARFDTAEGMSLQFACAAGTQAMLVTEIKQVATYTASASK
jgi:hypothetical protein